jgi:Pyrimidine dimer DNA glycosylase
MSSGIRQCESSPGEALRAAGWAAVTLECVQTFLPYADFAESAAVLDPVRLGKQRVEAYQILRTLAGITHGWRHHPAVKMWRGHIGSLARYTIAVCGEWERRGYADTVADKVREFESAAAEPPPWLGDSTLHASHRSNLLRKDPDWYRQFDWTEPNDLPYVWPV